MLPAIRFKVAILLLTLAFGPGVACSAPDPVFRNSSLAGLVDATGQSPHKEALEGRFRLILFGFTSCADVCPLTLLAMRESLDLLGQDARRVTPIFISVDPERDSGERLSSYVQAFDKRILGLTGSRETIENVAAAHGVFFAKRWVDASTNSYVFDHTASILLVRPDGSLVAAVSSVGSPKEVAQRVVDALEAAQRQQ